MGCGEASFLARRSPPSRGNPERPPADYPPGLIPSAASLIFRTDRMPNLIVRYFAILREQRGLSQEPLATAAATPQALYEELCARHGFTLPADRVRAAINGEFAAATATLRDGDEIVFIPPVAGG